MMNVNQPLFVSPTSHPIDYASVFKILLMTRPFYDIFIYTIVLKMPRFFTIFAVLVLIISNCEA